MKRLVLLFLLGSSWLGAQVVQPNLSQSNTLTGVSNGTDIPNKSASQQSVAWRLTFWYTGFTSVTMQIGCAADVAGAPGAYSAMTGAYDGTTNPVTVAAAPFAGTVAAKAYCPHVAAQVTGVVGVGSVTYYLVGYLGTNVSPSTVSATPGGTQNVNILQVASTPTVTGGVAGLMGVGGAAADGATFSGNPVLVGGHDTGTPSLAHIFQTDTFGDLVLAGVSAAQSDGSSNTPTIPGLGTSGAPTPSTQRSFPFYFNGSTWDRQFQCNTTATVALSGTSATQIIAGTASQVIRVCKVFVTSASAGTPNTNTFTLSTGTCAAAPTTLLIAAGVTGLDSDFGGALRGASSGALCLAESVANGDTATVTYVKY